MAFVIPFFIQHRGCPHRCLFCDQLAIAGKSGDQQDSTRRLEETITTWLARNRRKQEVQVAFYGGSFTCLPSAVQNSLLAIVRNYIRSGVVSSARLSTRPDCIDVAVCENLKEQGVKTVELGLQSMDDRVLEAVARGHDSDTGRQAALLVKRWGFELGIQLMPGLPRETTVSFFNGLRKVIAIGPDFVRLYPAVALKNTGLADLYRSGVWQPLSMNRAVALTAKARNILISNNIRVIRMGLQPSDTLAQQVLAGPYHPAFGERVITRVWYRKIRKLMASVEPGSILVVTISDRDYSAFVGPGRQNFRRLNQLPYGSRLVVRKDPSLKRFTFRYEIEQG
ncbi:MAG: radical SAM protein [Proteobacteria bacterium]|nr:MAG: radical SAM protein [Pseudomonadota bacterium]